MGVKSQFRFNFQREQIRARFGYNCKHTWRRQRRRRKLNVPRDDNDCTEEGLFTRGGNDDDEWKIAGKTTIKML